MASDSQPSADQLQDLERSRQETLASLLEIEDSTIRQLTRLTLPEIRSVKEEVARILPAGNLPAFVLSGLLKLKGRRVSPDQVNQDIVALMRGMSLIPQGLYGAAIAGPAVVLYAYQKLLQLAGKDAADAFPEGTWQFYLQFGLREDTARHANETVGFHQALPSHPEPAAMAAAWVCAALELLFDYDELLATYWSERVMLRLLMEEMAEVTGSERSSFVTLVQDWTRLCQYHRPSDGSDYISNRRALFRSFIQDRLNDLLPGAKQRLRARYEAQLVEELPAYQEQMTLLAALQPGAYQECREPIPIWQAAVAFIWEGHTYLLPACQYDQYGHPLCYPTFPENASPLPISLLPNGELGDAKAHQALVVDREGRTWYRESGRLVGRIRPPTPEEVYGWTAAIFSARFAKPPPNLDLVLAESPRSLQRQLRGKLSAATQAELDALRRVPIILNWDRRSYALPLAYIRRGGRRGIGDHALTLFFTDRSMVFDQSHIFFDGTWGLAVAEILTDSAIHWFHHLAGSRPDASKVRNPMPLELSGALQHEAVAKPKNRLDEAAAESAGVETSHIYRLRKWLHQRGVRLTVNDLLLLYRFFHSTWYRPSRTLIQALEAFQSRVRSTEAQSAYQAIEDTLAHFHETNPALLIPMDASNVSPRERVFPTTFRNPLTEIRNRFVTAQDHYRVYRIQTNSDHWLDFDRARRELLTYLKAFGELMDTLKAVTMRGESFNTATIRLLAHVPPSMQNLLDQIPQHIGVLNEVIKGSEVFSNVGRVAPGTSLTRFISAKDDGQTKELIWGILTDDQGQMHITLRDFRPFVPQLLALGETELADLLAKDYLDGYVQGLNHFVAELSMLITVKEPESPVKS
jgi:hypothetical protein